jgi:hypothetical protein
MMTTNIHQLRKTDDFAAPAEHATAPQQSHRFASQAAQASPPFLVVAGDQRLTAHSIA